MRRVIQHLEQVKIEARNELIQKFGRDAVTAAEGQPDVRQEGRNGKTYLLLDHDSRRGYSDDGPDHGFDFGGGLQ